MRRCVIGLMVGAVMGLACALPRASADSAASARPSGPAPEASPGGADASQGLDQEMTVLEHRRDRVIAQLDNRMVVIAQRVPTAPVVSAQVWVKTGSIYEQEHEGAGLSHYLEHLLAGGSTTHRTEAQSNAQLGRIGAQTNAATGLSTVRYHINTTADHSDEAIDLLSDWLLHAKITPTEFKREGQVIQREFSMGRGEPGRIFWKLTQRARYTAHPAMYPTIGYESLFKGVTRPEVVDFYHRMYVPNNMVFVVVGDIDPAEAARRVAMRCGGAKAGDLPKLKLPDQRPITKPKRETGRADIQRPRLRLAWPGTKLAQEHDYAMDLLAVILGQGESSRLVRSVRDKRGLVSTIDAYNLSFAWGRGFFAIDAELAGQKPDTGKVKAAILDQVARVRDHGVSDAELARAKREVMSSVVQSNQTASGIAARLARDVISTGDPDYLAKYAQRVQGLTAEDVKAAADALLTPDKLITVRLLPATKKHPIADLSRPERAQSLNDVPTHRVRLDNRELVDEMRAALADASHTTAPAEVDPPVRFTLDNGLRVIVQRSTVVPAAAMQIYSLGGLLGDPPDKPGMSNAMASMLTRGVQGMDADQINRTVESLGASLLAGSGNNTVYARATALKADWPRILGLLADVVQRPTFPADQWEQVRPRVLAAIGRQRDVWYGELRRDFRQAYFGDHPWARTPLGEAKVVKELSAKDLASFFQTQFKADRSVLAIVGDVDPAKVRAAVAREFGSLKPAKGGAFDPPKPGKPDSRLVEDHTGKPVTAVQVGFGPGIARDSPDYAGVRVLARLMSDFPSGYLDQALRGNGPGLVYAVSGGAVTGVVPGYFAIMFNTRADSAAAALGRAMAVVSRVKTRPVPDDDLQRARAKVLSSELLAKQSNADRAADAALDELYGVHDPASKHFIAAVKATDARAVSRLAREYLVNPVAVVMSGQSIPAGELKAAMHEDAEPSASAPAGSK